MGDFEDAAGEEQITQTYALLEATDERTLLIDTGPHSEISGIHSED